MFNVCMLIHFKTRIRIKTEKKEITEKPTTKNNINI